MREIYLKVFTNKKIICLNPPFELGKTGENDSTRINLNVPDEIANYYNYLVLRSPENTNYIVSLGSSLQYIVEAWVTNQIGQWQIEYISTSQEDISGGVLDPSQAILISDPISANVVKSNASDDLHFPPTPETEILETRLEEKMDEVVFVVNKILEEGLEVDVTQIIEAIQDLEIHADVDFAQVLNAIDSTESALSAKIDNISVDLTPVLTALSELRTLILAIPTNDYTQKLNTIENKIDNIPGGQDYSQQLTRIENKVDAIPTTNYQNDINAIKSNTYDNTNNKSVTTIANEIKSAVANIPTTDNAADITAIKNKVNQIPTNDYTSDITTIKNNQQRTDQYENYVWNEQTQDYDIRFIDVVMKQADDLRAIRDAVADRPVYQDGQPSSLFTQNTAMNVLYMLNSTIEHTVLLQLSSIMQSESRIEAKLANVESALNAIVGGNS